MEVELTPNLEDAIKRLYEASLDGSISILNTLLQENRSILNRVSLSPFGETPLHIAALFGHLEFCQVLLDKKPSFANEGDTKGRCPLHLASAEGHTEVVTALLHVNPNICLSRDQDDKLPLHLAATRGRMGAIRELTRACPDSVKEMTDDDGSILHLCTRYNHLEALRFIVQLVTGDQQLLAGKDKEGNTVLHLAVRLKQIKTIKYLLSLPEMRTVASTLNSAGFTALDVLEQFPRDFISLAIEDILIKAGVQRSANMAIAQVQMPVPAPRPSIASQPDIAPVQPRASSTSITSQVGITTVPSQGIASRPDIASHQSPTSLTSIVGQPVEPHQPCCWERWESFWGKYLQYRGNWIEETREPLMIVATVIATMTFQSTLSPPGGVWQDDTQTDMCDGYGFCEPGTAILGYFWSKNFLRFVKFNSISFFSSLCVVLILISGFPLKNKFIMWILTVAMITSITFMLLTYMWALGLVSPDHIFHRIRRLGYLLVGIWAALIVFVGSIQAGHFVFWLRKRYVRRSMSRPLSDGAVSSVQDSGNN